MTHILALNEQRRHSDPLVHKLTLTGNPKSTQQCYRMTKQGGYMINECTHLKFSYQSEARQQWRLPILDTDLVVICELYFGDKRKRDVDNFNKLWLDALEGIVYKNDSQVQQLTIRKLYDKDNPRIELQVYSIPITVLPTKQ
jgi:Holliday junction resolvase RusA-like endonuclease